MSKYRNIQKTGIVILGLFIVSTVIVSAFLIGSVGGCNLNDSSRIEAETRPKSSFVKDDFSSILSEEKNGLGSISVNNITFHEEGFVWYNSTSYGFLYDDLLDKTLNISYKQTVFTDTISPAVVYNLNDSLVDRSYITVELNETLNVQYNQTQGIQDGQFGGYMVWGPRLYPSILKEVYVENSSIPIEKLNSSDYSIDAYNFMVFDYYKFFNNLDFNNFSLHLIWHFNLTISGWSLTQSNDEDFLIEEEEQLISPELSYSFTVLGQKYNSTQTGLEVIDAENLILNLSITPPDKDLLKNHVLKVNNVQISQSLLYKYLLSDNTIKINVNGNNSNLYLKFNVDFTVKFIDPVDSTWAIDRLVKNKNIRERIYIPSIIGGPEQIYLKNLKIVETTLFSEQIISNTSQFGREVNFFKIIIEEYQSSDELQNSLAFTENSTRSTGLNILLPYLIKGEACPLVFRYKTAYDLRILITDNINSPLIDAEVKLYYYGALYGTYMSNEDTQPIPTPKTDENGEILIKNVPNGNYTLKIYQNDQKIMETTVTTYTDINYVVTNVIHAPLWILLFASVSLTIFVIGFVFYNHNKKKRI